MVLIITVIPIKSVRIFLGLLFVLILPCYIFIAALFLKKADVYSIERVALSFGFSIAIVPSIGFILNYTPLAKKTGSLVGVTLSHGLINIFLYLIFPFTSK